MQLKQLIYVILYIHYPIVSSIYPRSKFIFIYVDVLMHHCIHLIYFLSIFKCAKTSGEAATVPVTESSIWFIIKILLYCIILCSKHNGKTPFRLFCSAKHSVLKRLIGLWHQGLNRNSDLDKMQCCLAGIKLSENRSHGLKGHSSVFLYSLQSSH